MKEARVRFNADNDGLHIKPKLIVIPYMSTLSVVNFPFLIEVTPFRGHVTYTFGFLKKKVSSLIERYFFCFLQIPPSYFLGKAQKYKKKI